MATNVTWLPQVPRTSEQVFGAEAVAFPLSDDLEYIPFTPDNVEAWIEAQLLDCQNLARQHGLTKTASALDTALDQLGQFTVQCDSPGESAEEPGHGIALVR